MKKRNIISIGITLVVWFIMFYFELPAINLQNQQFWSFAVGMIVVAVVINLWPAIKYIAENRSIYTPKDLFLKFKKVIIAAAAFALIYGVGMLLSSPILRASDYSKLLAVENGNFSSDVQEVDYSQIPILDRDSAAILSERKMGSMIDMVSQYEVGNNYSQINYNGKPVRVTPLKYSSVFKWFINRSTGIPAYIKIDMATQDTELVKLENGIKISDCEYFGRNLSRYLRFRYPTAMFEGHYFEIDDNGTPYWINPVIKKTIGLFGGVDIKGAVFVNAVTGEHQYYDVKDIPQWVDEVYSARLLVSQYDYYGTLKNGFINSVLGQKGCLQTTEGYNYIALDDDVWVYTGITSVTGDESIVGFVLMNQRTKETKYYQLSGAKEYSAMASAEGQVQNLRYTAAFPLLLNVEGKPTYFMALKDGSGLVKKYAMVNIEKYQIVAIGDSVAECEKNYRRLMSENGIASEVSKEDKNSVKGIVENVFDVVIDGNSYRYIKLVGDDRLYGTMVKDKLTILTVKETDSIEIVGYGSESGDFIEIDSFEVLKSE